MVVEEGVASPEDVDRMWEIFTNPGVPRFRLMHGLGSTLCSTSKSTTHSREGMPGGRAKLLRKCVDEGR